MTLKTCTGRTASETLCDILLCKLMTTVATATTVVYTAAQKITGKIHRHGFCTPSKQASLLCPTSASARAVGPAASLPWAACLCK